MDSVVGIDRCPKSRPERGDRLDSGAQASVVIPRRVLVRSRRARRADTTVTRFVRHKRV